MKHSLILSMAAVVGAFALFATPVEAGDRRKHHRDHDDDRYRGGRNQVSHFQRARLHRARHYHPVRYLPAPTFQVGFVVGSGHGYRRCR